MNDLNLDLEREVNKNVMNHLVARIGAREVCFSHPEGEHVATNRQPHKTCILYTVVRDCQRQKTDSLYTGSGFLTSAAA